RANAASHGWDLDGIQIQELQPAENLRPEEQYTLFHPSEIELGDLSKNVFAAVEKFRPARAVLDSVSDMRLLARDSLRYRRQILGLPATTLRSGLKEVDALLDDGVPMGTTTLVLGPSGVGKSTLVGQYLCAAASKGLCAAAFLFDEQRATFISRSDALGMKMS